MTWADTLNDNPVLSLLIFVLLQIPILYSLSSTCRYFIRMTAYYLTMLVASSCCVPLSALAYYQKRGGVYAFASFRFFSFWMDMDLEIRDQQKLEGDECSVIISNHQSSLDVCGMGAAWPDRCTCMMKKSLLYVPGFNLTAWLCGTIFVDRINRGQDAIKEAADKIHEKGLKIWVFPEGTRHHKRGMLPFKKGAFNIAVKAQIPIVPIVFSSYEPFYSKKNRYFHSHGQVVAQVLDPIPTKGLTMDDVPALADRIRNQMLEVFEKVSAEAYERQKAVNLTHGLPPPPAPSDDKAE